MMEKFLWNNRLMKTDELFRLIFSRQIFRELDVRKKRHERRSNSVQAGISASMFSALVAVKYGHLLRCIITTPIYDFTTHCRLLFFVTELVAQSEIWRLKKPDSEATQSNNSQTEKFKFVGCLIPHFLLEKLEEKGLAWKNKR